MVCLPQPGGGAAQVLHDGAVALVSVGGAKYGAAGHERVGACRHNGSDIASLDAAVHLEPDRLAARGLVGIDAAVLAELLGARPVECAL